MRTNVPRLRFSDPFWRASTDQPVAPSVRCFWTFADGATPATNGPVTSHAYSAEGTYRATLTVTDNDGQTGQAEVLVEVTGPLVAGDKRVAGSGSIARGLGGGIIQIRK